MVTHKSFACQIKKPSACTAIIYLHLLNELQNTLTICDSLSASVVLHSRNYTTVFLCIIDTKYFNSSENKEPFANNVLMPLETKAQVNVIYMQTQNIEHRSMHTE